MNSNSPDSEAPGRALPCTTASGFVALLVGIGTGLITKWADGSSLSWLGDLGTGLGFWIFVTAGIGWLAPSRSSATARAAAFFVGLNVGYYAYTIHVLGYPVDRLTVLVWSALAVTACPPLALIVRVGRERPVPGAIVMGVAAAAISSTGYVAVMWDQMVHGLHGGPDHRIEGLLSLLMAGVLVAAPRRPRLVLVALTAAVVSSWPVRHLMETLFGNLPVL